MDFSEGRLAWEAADLQQSLIRVPPHATMPLVLKRFVEHVGMFPHELFKYAFSMVRPKSKSAYKYAMTSRFG